MLLILLEASSLALPYHFPDSTPPQDPAALCQGVTNKEACPCRCPSLTQGGLESAVGWSHLTGSSGGKSLVCSVCQFRGVNTPTAADFKFPVA